MIPFYNAGLRFECTRCSYCCRYTPGYVFLSHNDLERVVTRFNSDRDEFIAKYCRFVDMNGQKRLSLVEKENFDCVFWQQGGCGIYEHRPLQCRSYPFWETNLRSHTDWADLAFFCPGVGKGTCVSQDTIEAWLSAMKNEDYDFS